MEEIIRDYNVRVVFKQLEGARGMVQKKDTGYVVVLAEHLSDERRNKSLAHELGHIVLGHLDERSYLSESDKEIEANLFSVFI